MMEFFRLECGFKMYEWGQIGMSSCIARFLASAQPEVSLYYDKPYAELWMGVHPSAPSIVQYSKEFLQNHLEMNQMLLTKSIIDVYGPTLPFLFKILSINKALSIQAHPDKKLAQILHDKDPKNYPDANHKPEMAIAITPFEALCGFRPLEEICEFLESVKVFNELIGNEVALDFIKHVKTKQNEESNRLMLSTLFKTFIQQPKTRVETCAKTLIEFILENKKTEWGDLILRLNEQFPLDIGLFCVFLLNYIQLKPGEGLFLEANTPHAYLSGEIVECMVSSDNVVRIGFTPKYKDANTLVSMLSYKYGLESIKKMEGEVFERSKGEGDIRLFKPPINEFEVMKIFIKKDQKHWIDGLKGPSIMICIKGQGEVEVNRNIYEINLGFVYFVGAFVEIKMIGKSEEWIIYRAFLEI
ncbi:mannose-6-phosphate isomerase, class I [Pneumocystis carinii B80]|uniref:Mannose-6-phosphate isomerase n=1 Tax=Pneumocystis carinii (strain B80) TaxID=1408658 RepID=A0A0W4ZLY6_PNEC8|nr:mannose-6-phosphate isomerase, class I [Pneumocystis carinii B80]KTW29397.1 mannose-6-phosphate isomerase, class I [Pneumocystis carinii B80]